jgi:prolyl-tRNA editing enzyme YbaK/EbsC (Cys-tRNA(Pro) deacylase)
MNNNLSPSAQRVQDALNVFGLSCQVIEMPASTRTALEAADAVGCQVGQIVKSLVFKGKHTGKGVLALVSGANRANEIRLEEAVGEQVEKANADFVRQMTGYAIGGVPPVGLASPLITLIDEDLLAYEIIWAAAGTPNAVFSLNPADLPRITGGKVVPIS